MARRWGVALVVAVVVVSTTCTSDDGASTSASTDTTTEVAYTAVVVGETEVDPVYRQGLARVPDGWVFSFNDGLFRTDDALVQTGASMPAIPDDWRARGFDHIGDIDVVDGVVYAPLEQPDYDVGRQAMLLYDASTFTYLGGVDVAQRHNSFVTVDQATGIAYSMDEFGGSALLRYDTRDDWRPLEPLTMTSYVDRVQGGDVFDGAVWLSTDDATDGVFRVDLASGEVQPLGSIGHTEGEGEGIDATPVPSGDLHVLTLDPAVIPVRMIALRVDRST